jgi:hypothetical protein
MKTDDLKFLSQPPVPIEKVSGAFMEGSPKELSRSCLRLKDRALEQALLAAGGDSSAPIYRAVLATIHTTLANVAFSSVIVTQNAARLAVAARRDSVADLEKKVADLETKLADALAREARTTALLNRLAAQVEALTASAPLDTLEDVIEASKPRLTVVPTPTSKQESSHHAD